MAVRNEAQLKCAEEALESIKLEEQSKSGHRVITLADVLQRYGGAQCDFAWEYSEDKRFIHYEIDGESRCSEVFEDALSGERSVFLVLPIEYIHHDELINPRPVNLNLINLIREFASGNPQLQQCLARVDSPGRKAAQADRIRCPDGKKAQQVTIPGQAAAIPRGTWLRAR